ncbi:MAG: hypothetical protein M3256_13565 [Actinomycetota bacterium]|nr:hypothetical protein [Actinomycetota bacterium]
MEIGTVRSRLARARVALKGLIAEPDESAAGARN